MQEGRAFWVRRAAQKEEENTLLQEAGTGGMPHAASATCHAAALDASSFHPTPQDAHHTA